MPIARFQMPDGRIGRFEVPEGTTPEQAQSLIASQVSNPEFQSEPAVIGKGGLQDSLREVLGNQDWVTRNAVGAGTALSNLYEGAKQFVGKSNPDQIQANKTIREEAPIGGIVGDAALTAVPFGLAGTSVKAAAGVGSAYGALQPVEGDVVKGKLTNAALGGLFGAGGQLVANKTGDMIASKVANLAASKSKNAPIDKTIKDAIDAGYVLPPGQINPSMTNRVLESAGGKIATQQMASNRNQTVTDLLARKAAGLTPDTPITPDTLRAARDVIKQPYTEISSLGLQPKLDSLDAARSEANAAWREYSRQGTRSALNDYKKFSSDAKNIEKEIENSLFKANKPDLMRQFKEARVALAKNHDVESALIEGGGSIDARAIAKMYQRGDKMTGELETIGRFANNFPKVAQPDKTVGTPDAHNLRYIASLLMGSGGGAAMGPAGIAAGAIPFFSGPASRGIMFSKAAQQALANPSYSLGLPTRAMGGLLGQAPIGGTVLGLDAFRQ